MKELQRGERTAEAMEGHLDSLEKKIEELLAQV
jgi:exonuclease VII small subunit